MKHLLRRRDTEALLEGETPNEDAGLDDVDAFLASMRVEFGAMPAPEPRPTLAATLDGRRELRPASGPSPKPTFPAAGPRPHRLRPVVVVFATGAVLFGGLASAGALPGPAQRVTADLGSHVGIHLPGASDAQPRPVDDVEPGTGSTGTPSGTRPTTGSTTGSSGVPTAPSTVPGLPSPTTPTTTPTLPTPSLPSPILPLPLPSLPELRWPASGTGVLPSVPNS